MRNIVDIVKEMNNDINCELLKFTRENRAEISKRILMFLRHFVEALSLYILSTDKNEKLNYNYDNIQESLKYIRTQPQTLFIERFHYMLQGSISHYYENEKISERLMLKYYEYLVQLRKFFIKYYKLDILKNIYKFQVYQDPKFLEYYEKIFIKAKALPVEKGSLFGGERYYVQKVNQILVFDELYYEITLSSANDFATKYDRMIVYSRVPIFDSYAINVKYKRGKINVFGKEMPINILTSWHVSIRPCELINFGRILGMDFSIQTSSKEYEQLMVYLTKYKINLSQLVKLDPHLYQNIRQKITTGVEKVRIFTMLDKCRTLMLGNQAGCNILSYLLFRVNNKVIKYQLCNIQNSELSNLYLQFGCIPFDKMPYNTDLIHHNTVISDLLNSVDINGREHELLGRKLVSNIEKEGILYTSISELTNVENIDSLVKDYNALIYKKKHQSREIHKEHNNLYIQEYEDNIVNIINSVIGLSKKGVDDYNTIFENWYNGIDPNMYAAEKIDKLKNMFMKTRVSLIYGAAGTGKTYMITALAEIFADKKILYLAQTNTAVNNLINKVNHNIKNFKFMTIYQFVKNETDVFYDIIVLDECGIVSNRDMSDVLDKAIFEQLILVGDVYQIEAISYGNWFNMLRYFVPNYVVNDLKIPFRTDDKELLRLWEKVRKNTSDIQESLDRNGFSEDLSDSIFLPESYDEIILCLNYDGLYGINNINRFLQSNNQNTPIYWGIWTYKKDDPIIFNDARRFNGLIYNNLKGRITDIKKSELNIIFDIDVPLNLESINPKDYNLQGIKYVGNGHSIISIMVNKIKNTDNDDQNADNVVPFQVAYATSIHKSQGLEYESVKVVITNDVEEKISKNVFYTAITRTKNKLKVYWTPETEKTTISRFTSNFNMRDISILSQKYKLKLYTDNEIE